METVLESHQTPSPIGPSSGATGTPSDGKDPKKESDEKGKPKELVGDKAKRLAEYNLKVARVQLESTREIYLASVDDASSAVVKLGEIVGQLAKLDVRKRQVICPRRTLETVLMVTLYQLNIGRRRDGKHG